MKHVKRWLVPALALVVVLLIWLLWPDRKLAQAKALQKELTSPAAKSMPAEQRREKWQQFRDIQKTLSPAQRESLSAESRKRQQEKLVRYAKMTPAEKTRYLDEQINSMEQFRQKMQQKGGKQVNTALGSPAQGKGGGQTKRGDKSTPQGRDQGRQRWLDSSSPAERALFSQYSRDLNARRAQRGLQPMGRGGPER